MSRASRGNLSNGWEDAVGKPSVVLELRPALDGFAGIPQETRLLFKCLKELKHFSVHGLLQHPTRLLFKASRIRKPGLAVRRRYTDARRIYNQSRFVVSFGEHPFYTLSDKAMEFCSKKALGYQLLFKTALGVPSLKLGAFDPSLFKDFVWRSLFSKTLTAKDYDLVSTSMFYTCRAPWHVMHKAGLASLNFSRVAKFPRFNSKGIDIFIGQTPYPGRFSRDTRLIVRYHDAVPVFMPHTISDKSRHQAVHFHALMSNVQAGAWFACVSESARSELLTMFPEAAERAVTIHNMISEHYFAEPSDRSQLQNIVLSSIYEGDLDKGIDLRPKFLSNSEKERFYDKRATFLDDTRYLLIVSTIEPRKNHARLFAAWQYLREHHDSNLKLIVVGTLGWDYKSIVSPMMEWIQRGEIFMLEKVPAAAMRVLYRHALVTICPSFAEGFGFSGAESMACGGVVAASDLPVHREVYKDAAIYFNPYSTMSLVNVLEKFILEENGGQLRETLIERGADIVQDYRIDRIAPKWQEFLLNVLNDSEVY